MSAASKNAGPVRLMDQEGGPDARRRWCDSTPVRDGPGGEVIP